MKRIVYLVVVFSILENAFCADDPDVTVAAPMLPSAATVAPPALPATTESPAAPTAPPLPATTVPPTVPATTVPPTAPSLPAATVPPAVPSLPATTVPPAAPPVPTLPVPPAAPGLPAPLPPLWSSAVPPPGRLPGQLWFRPGFPWPPAVPTTPPLPPLPAPPTLPQLPTGLPANVSIIPPLDPASAQLADFSFRHPRPIGVLTTSAGKPVELRESVSFNADVFNNAYFYDLQTATDRERVRERPIFAKGTGAFGYFEVTNDVSKITKAEVFNGVGKRTPVAVRFSTALQNLGGNDLTREITGMSVKFYSNEGNLDLVGLGIPVYLYREANGFLKILHPFKRNPRTNLYDATMRAEVLTLLPDLLNSFLWIASDFGQSNGYRKVDSFPIQTFEVYNEKGESSFVRFNFRSEQGTEFLTEESIRILGALDADYSTRDLYNAIARREFPAWRLEMDVIKKQDLKKLTYNPFDVTRLLENGTYQTVTIGRLVLNKNPDNWFPAVEQAAYNPGNLVPGIRGPPDDMFKARRMAYRDSQNYRIGINHNNVEVNRPRHSKAFNRDGRAPARGNARDAPNYYENSFHGPAPYVDTARPRRKLMIYDRNAVDLQPAADFYNNIITSQAGKGRLAFIVAAVVVNGAAETQARIVRLMYLIDRDLGLRVATLLAALDAARAVPPSYVPIDTNPTVVEAVPGPVPAAG